MTLRVVAALRFLRGHVVALANYRLQLRNSLSAKIILKLKYVKHSSELFLIYGVRIAKIAANSHTQQQKIKYCYR